MRRRLKTWFLATTVALLGLPVVGGTAAASPRPAATEIGVSATEIRIAVVADVDNSFSPGLNQGNVDAIRAFADEMNRHGGLAGRRLAVDFYDSRLSASDTQNAIIQACERDFALVGTGANFLTDISPIVSCPDRAGRPTGIPDLSTFSLDPTYQCSPVTFQVSPPDIDCATRHDARESYRVQVGPAAYYRRRAGGLHGIYVLSGDLKSVRDASAPLVAGYTTVGVKQDGEGAYFVSSVAPRSALTPDVQVIKQQASTFVYAGIPVANVAALRQEAKVQGVKSVKVWSCAFECYDRKFLSAGGADVEGQYVTSSTIPFEEAKTVPAIGRYLKAVGRDHADGFGAQGWTAGLLFRDVLAMVDRSAGPNGLTRAAFFEALRQVHHFTADGILGTTDIGRKVPTNCFMLMQVRSGRFVRAYPSRPGRFDCRPKNRRTIELDLLQ